MEAGREWVFPLGAIALLILFAWLPASGQQAAQMTNCPNCGMVLKQWAHTNHEFTNEEGRFRSCSLHCVADISVKSGLAPRDVKVAVASRPDEMIPVEKAVYVIGSSAPGTMTRVSKYAFESRADADRFVVEKGGKIGTFADAFELAKGEILADKEMIQARRKSTGKIADPSEQDRCLVCDMVPAKYPKNNAQATRTDQKGRFHFCSNRCMFEFLGDPKKYGIEPADVGALWVHDYASGRYIFGKAAFYIVGSKVHGPMGPEAIPFDLRSEAMSFSRENGGTVIGFKEVKLDKIKAK